MTVQRSVERNKRAIRGLRVQRTSASVVTINPGACVDVTGLYAFDLAADQAVDITDSGINGLDTGAEAADTWYSVWLVAGATGVGGLLSLSSTAPTLPSGYDIVKRRVGWAYNSGTDFRDWHVYRLGSAAIYLFDQEPNDGELEIVNISSTTTMTAVAASIGIPPTSERGVFILGQGINAGGTVIETVFLNKAGLSETSPSLRATGRRIDFHSDASNVLEYVQCDDTVNKQIQYRGTATQILTSIDVVGFVDQLEEDGF